MSEQLQYNTSQLRSGADGVGSAGEDLQAKFHALKAEVGDMSAFGPGHDAVGPIAQMIYEAVLEAVEESITSGSGSYSDFSDKMHTAADIYDQGEQDNADIAKGSV